MLHFSSFPSPNYTERPKDTIIDTIIIHHTDMTNAKDALELLCNPKAQVSCHYLIAKDATIYQLVEDHLRARHAGQSSWRGKTELNDNSIGIELDNNGRESFTSTQMNSLLLLCKDLLKKHPIEQRNIVAHADIAPHRKVDPNHFFDWKSMWQHGVGIYSNAQDENVEILFKFGMTQPNIITTKQNLVKFGYGITNLSDEFDLELVNVIHAFKRHFCVETYENYFWDTLADIRLKDLLKSIS